MNYNAAFKNVLSKYGYEVIGNNQLLRSILSDLVKDSIVDKQLIAAFAILNADNLLYVTIEHLSLVEAKDFIRKKIVASNKSYSVEQYIRSTEPLLLLLYPNEYVLYKGNAKEVVNNVVRNRQPVDSMALANPIVRRGKQSPAQVVNRINKRNQANNILQFNSISVYAVCSQLVINNSNGGDVRILDTNNKDVTSQITANIKKNALSLHLFSDRQRYTIYLPKKIYDSLEVIFSGNILTIEKTKYEQFLVKKLKIDANSAVVSVNAKAHVFICNLSRGMFNAFGEYADVTINSNSADCYLGLTGIKAHKFNIANNSGKIEIEFYGYSVRPKINHFLKKINIVQGKYYVNGKPVSFNLLTNSGSIKVH